MKRRRIAHLTSVHKRYDIRIFHKQCSSLKKRHEVHLIVSDGLGDEKINGIKIYDVGHKNGRLKRMILTTNKIYRKAIELDVDLYHLHDPELLPVGNKLKKKGKIVLYDAHEDLPRQIASKSYLNTFIKPILSKCIENYENYIVKKLDGIVTATPYIENRFKKVNPKALSINNFPIIEELKSNKDWNTRNKTIAYVGGISKIRGIIEVVKALELVDANISLELAGIFSERTTELIVKRLEGWKKVNELGLINRNQVSQVLSKCAIGLVTFLPEPNHINAQPNKMFEYMSAGIPVIGSNFPLWREIIESSNCGICVDPLNPKEIAEAINYIINNEQEAKLMGNNGQKAVSEKYNWKNEEIKLFSLYEDLLSN